MFFRKKAHMTAIIFFGFFVKNHFFYLSEGVRGPPGPILGYPPPEKGSSVDLGALELFLGFIDRIYASIVPLYL